MAHARFCSHVVQLTTHAPNSISGRCSPRQAHAPDSISGGCWPRQTLGFVANPFQRTTWARCGRSHPLLLIMVGLSSWRPSLEMKQNNVVFEWKNNCLGSYDRSTEACGTWLWTVKHQLIRCLTMRIQAPVELVLRVSSQEPIQKMLDRYDSSTIASSAWLWTVNHLLVRCLTVRSQEPFWWWSQELLF